MQRLAQLLLEEVAVHDVDGGLRTKRSEKDVEKVRKGITRKSKYCDEKE